jgi:hypothetical protein
MEHLIDIFGEDSDTVKQCNSVNREGFQDVLLGPPAASLAER